jgi:RNA polymerase sigma-70 factor (ECF subfamily)
MGNTTLNEFRPGSSTHLDLFSAARFRTTRWSMVLQAAGTGWSAPDSVGALEKLCRAYWNPIYSYVLRAGHDAHAAQDLTQEFFSRMLHNDWLSGVHPSKGRFRSFLLAAVKHFLANEWDRAHALKRGGAATTVSLDAAEGAERDALEPVTDNGPDKLFERRWVETVLARVNGRLRRDYEAAGQGDRFEVLKIYLLNDYDPLSYADVAAKLGISESAVKSAIYKLRQRYGELFRAEIAQTLDDPGEVDEEIRFLFRVLSE